jgi:SAM-dependent methyltransferase
MIFFTICSRNFVGYSGALWESLRQFYPDLKFYLVLCDDDSGFDYLSLQYPVIKISDLGIRPIDDMKARYNITELNTSLKPFAFDYIFSNHPGETVVYLDPDIFVVSRLVELEQAFREGAECVLTPHICEPAEFAEMNDLKFLTYGIYNFGFCALRDSIQTRRLVAWWGRRLQEFCVIDFPRGLFVDQKFGDYFPAFVEKTKILRHPGYNVAYWNLSQRRLRKADGEWTSNGVPLRFLHFSGNRIEDTDVFTRHAGQFNVRNTPVLVELLASYRHSISRNGHSFYSVIPYAFSWSGSAGFNEHTPEELQRRAQQGEARKPHLPFTRYQSFEQYAADRQFIARTVKERHDVEKAAAGSAEVFSNVGYCVGCGATQHFETSLMYGAAGPDGVTVPNWREHQSCKCGLTNRIRGALSFIDQQTKVSEDASVYITEQVTDLFKRLKTRWPNLIGSEYLSPEVIPGTIVDGIRHEDVQNISIPDASLDLAISLDVLEHVPDPDRAFREFARCLKPGGTFIFTVPFSYDHASDVIRAELDEEGHIHHILPPEYHGNPLDMENGSLCFRYFSWDTIRRLESAGFEQAGAFAYWSQDLMHFGDPQFILYAKKAQIL